MRNPPMRLLLLLLALAFLATPSLASAQERGKITVKKLYNQFSLLCVTEDAKEQAEQEAALYSGSDRGRDAVGRVSAKIEEMSRYKASLERMVEKYITARQLEWHETADIASKIGLEDDIKKVQALADSSCDD
jgi:hypothetical protein